MTKDNKKVQKEGMIQVMLAHSVMETNNSLTTGKMCNYVILLKLLIHYQPSFLMSILTFLVPYKSWKSKFQPAIILEISFI